MFRVKVLLTVAVVCVAIPALAGNVAVGSCKPSLPSYPTIQQAVNSVPVGTIVQVCPGVYPEQVTINKNLTIKGISDGNSGAAIITVPGGGLTQNTTSLSSGRPIAAQLLVQAPATAVTITGITVDGNGNGIADCTLNPIGIYYQNASGIVSHTAVMNEVLSSGLEGCQSGLGIFVQSGNSGSSTVNMNNNHVENYQKNGITGNEAGTNVTIANNTVIGQGPTTGAAENSIQIGFGATGSVTGNTVGSDIWAPDNIGDPGDAAAGILVYASHGVNVSANNVSNTQFGIALVSDPNFGDADASTVTKNTVASTHIFDGIDVCSSGNTVTSNIVNGSDESAVHIDDSCTGASSGNIVTKNTLNSACAGILSGPGASGNTTSPNTFFNDVSLRLTGTQCTPPPARPIGEAHRSAGKPKAARP